VIPREGVERPAEDFIEVRDRFFVIPREGVER